MHREFRTPLRYSLAALGLAVAVACGGGGGSSSGGGSTTTPASSLHYTAPTGMQATDYYFDVDSGQDSSKLTLKLVGPSGIQSNGVAFFLTADAAKAAWTGAGGSDAYLKEGAIFSLGSGSKLLKGKVSSGDLQGGIFQKGLAAPVTYSGTNALVSVALKLASGATTGAVTLGVTSGLQAKALDSTGTMVPIQIRFGTLEAK